MTAPATQPEDEQLREAILSLFHRTEGDEDFLKKHLTSPNKCDMDLAAPRCAKRVKELEKLFKNYSSRHDTARDQALLTELLGELRREQRTSAEIEQVVSPLDEYKQGFNVGIDLAASLLKSRLGKQS